VKFLRQAKLFCFTLPAQCAVQALCNGQVSFRPSVCPVDRHLLAPGTGYRSDSGTLRAEVRGSTQTCFICSFYPRDALLARCYVHVPVIPFLSFRVEAGVLSKRLNKSSWLWVQKLSSVYSKLHFKGIRVNPKLNASTSRYITSSQILNLSRHGMSQYKYRQYSIARLWRLYPTKRTPLFTTCMSRHPASRGSFDSA